MEDPFFFFAKDSRRERNIFDDKNEKILWKRISAGANLLGAFFKSLDFNIIK